MPELENLKDERIAVLKAARYTVVKIAEKMGMSRENAFRRLAKPEVKERVRELTRIDLSKYKVEVNDILQAVVDMAYDDSVKDTTRLEALKTLGKNVGIFRDRLALEGGDSPIEHSMSPELRKTIDDIYKAARSK